VGWKGAYRSLEVPICALCMGHAARRTMLSVSGLYFQEAAAPELCKSES
jgi:hypothetical protein